MTRYFCQKCDRITSETKDYSVLTNKPCRICGDITIPKSYEQFLETKERVKHQGVWVIHKYDKDTFPSNPHAHNEETGEKLNLFTGEIHHPVTRQIVGKMSDKDLKEFWNKSKLLRAL